MTYRIRNWEKHQHYSESRKMHWIKVYRDLLDDMEWFTLTPVEAKFLVNLWLLASETYGQLPEINKIAFRLRMSEKDVISLISHLEHWLICTDSKPLADGYTPASLDKIRVDRDQDRDKRESKGTQTNDNGKVTHEQVQSIVDYWNAQAVLPTARGISEKRDKAIRALLKDTATRNCWKDSIDAVTTSEWHLGKNERGWKITFDWWARPEKVLQFAERGKRERVDKHGNAVTIETDVDELGF